MDFTQFCDEIVGANEQKSSTDKSVITEASMGTFEALPEGWKFEKFDLLYPAENHASFVKATLIICNEIF